jgi:hypothetical protein
VWREEGPAAASVFFPSWLHGVRHVTKMQKKHMGFARMVTTGCGDQPQKPTTKNPRGFAQSDDSWVWRLRQPPRPGGIRRYAPPGLQTPQTHMQARHTQQPTHTHMHHHLSKVVRAACIISAEVASTCFFFILVTWGSSKCCIPHSGGAQVHPLAKECTMGRPVSATPLLLAAHLA